MNTTRSSHEFLRSDTALLLGLALAKLLLHLYTNAFAGYGIFRDELYHIACSEHPAAGYVDHPPFSIFVLMVSRMLLGDSLFAIRFVPAVVGAATVFITGMIAKELGGGKWAQALAALAAIASLIKLGMDAFYSMNTFDHLFWAFAAYVVIRLIKREQERDWQLLGFILGIGLLNKIGIGWLGAGLLVGMLMTPQRSWLATRRPWIAAAIAFVLSLPYVIWNIQNDFAHLEFIRNATQNKYASQRPLTFLTGQLLVNNPVTLPVWLSGLYFYFFKTEGKRFRLLGIAFLSVAGILLLNIHSKPEYLAPAYAMLFGAGGVMIERATAERFGWLRPACAALTIAGGLALAPAALPILPVESYIRYANALGITPSTAEGKELGQLPQFYADMFGWEEKARAVADVFHSLTPDEQQRCAIFADNYGRCAAIDYYGARYGLPKSIGPHNSYLLWGPRHYTGELVLILGGDLDDAQEVFESVEVKATVSSPYSMPYENNLNIYLCRNLRVPLREMWQRLRHYD